MLIPALIVEIACYILAPVVALFITKELRTDKVKRLGGEEVTMLREYIVKPLFWFQTHDNAVDEWWYGKYNEDHYFKFAREATQLDYDTKAWFRWYCRWMWMWRNCAYGFHYNLFSVMYEESKVYTEGIKKKTFWYEIAVRNHSWQLEAHVPIPFTDRYTSINIGWKPHKGFPRMMIANRIIGPIRQFQK